MKPWQCGFCSLTGAHVKGEDCPAFGKKWNKCHKCNYFAVMCKSQGNRFRKQKPCKGKVKRRVKRTAEGAKSTSSHDEFVRRATEHLSQAKKVTHRGSEYYQQVCKSKIELCGCTCRWKRKVVQMLKLSMSINIRHLYISQVINQFYILAI